MKRSCGGAQQWRRRAINPARAQAASAPCAVAAVIVVLHCATQQPSAGPLLCLRQHGNVVNCRIHRDELLNLSATALDTATRDHYTCASQIFRNGAIERV